MSVPSSVRRSRLRWITAESDDGSQRFGAGVWFDTLHVSTTRVGKFLRTYAVQLLGNR